MERGQILDMFMHKTMRINLAEGDYFQAIPLEVNDTYLIVRTMQAKVKVKLSEIEYLEFSKKHRIQECDNCGNIMYYKTNRYKKCSICGIDQPRSWMSHKKIEERFKDNYEQI